MNAHNDIAEIRRQLHNVARTAQRLATHLPDLHTLAWDPHVGEALEGDRPGFDSRPPPSGDPRARVILNEIAITTSRCEADLVGLERTMTRLFYAGSNSPDPSRGSLISRREHDQLLANQRRRPDTPARLIDQPTHPGKTQR